MRGNRGEWSEVYVLLKLLGDGELPLGNEHLEKLEGLFYPVIAVIREEISGQPITYKREALKVTFTLDEGECSISLPIELFSNKASELFHSIKQMKSVSALPDIESFLKQLGCTKIKASASQKTDVKVVIHDPRIGVTPTLGFSVKSMLGSPSTLVNASRATTVRFASTISEGDAVIDKINSIDGKSKIRKRLDAIDKEHIEFQYSTIPNTTFLNNLMLIDTKMPEILSYMLLYYYSGEATKVSDLVKLLEEYNPIGYTTITPSFYEYKIRKLLVEFALGMTPAKQWDGIYDATGGYIIVREDGGLLCYHVYDRNIFENYLFYNTQLDTPSTSRHSFGFINEDGTLDLNFQIRFIK